MSRRIPREAVLEVLERASSEGGGKPRRALHVAEICGLLELDASRMLDVERLLEDLGELGLVRAMPGRRWRLAGRGLAPQRTTTGVLVAHPRGFGFVAAEDGAGDVYVPGPAVGGALHGDRVELRVRSTDRGREGTVTSVLARGVERVAGVLRRKTRSAWMEPDDARMRSPLVVRGEPPSGARDGAAVVARIARYPMHPEELPEVEILEVLGPPGDPDVEVRKILLREGIEEPFPPECEEAAASFGDAPAEHELRGRTDWRALPILTIDPKDARDHDDAVHAESLGGGGWRVRVAIADVSHYVTQDGPVDREALRRGTSIYLPDRAVPMLPRALSSGICSLVDGVDRLALGVEIDLAPDGQVRGQRFVEAVIRSAASLTYENVAGLFHPDSGLDAGEAPRFATVLAQLREASGARRKVRLARGSLDFDLPEAKVVLGADGKTAETIVKTKKHPAVREAYGLVEDLMLLANEVVATQLINANLPAIYRVHAPPDEDRVAVFAEIAASFGFKLSAEEAGSPLALARFLRRLAGTPQERTLGYLLLRAMKQATYDTVNIGHFGLAASNYLHFTSPIRRYPDLTVHRTLRAWMQRAPLDVAATSSRLTAAAAESSRLERRAVDVEREVVALHRAMLMRDHLGDSFDARVVGLGPMGAFVEIEEPFVEALVRAENLGDDTFELDELGIRLTGRRTGRSVSLGDAVRVRILDASVERRQVEAVLELLGRQDEVEEPGKRGRRKARREVKPETSPRSPTRGKGQPGPKAKPRTRPPARAGGRKKK